MAQIDFSYGALESPAGGVVSISVFADRPYQRKEIEEDLRGVGFHCSGGGEVEALLSDDAGLLADVIVLDCPQVDAQRMAALARLDMRLARSGTHLIVSTSMTALDAVFTAFDQSDPQILVDASRAERIIAVGRVIGDASGARVRELAEEDRLELLRLSQQVDALAQRLDGYEAGQEHQGAGSRLADAGQSFNHFDKSGDAGEGAARLDLPDARLMREIIRHRQARAKFFDPALFADPAWDMLLDLAAAHAEGSNVAVTSLCIASGVPATTALRWIKQMVAAGLFERLEDRDDKRRAFISLSDKAAQAMARYFAEIGVEGLAVAA